MTAESSDPYLEAHRRAERFERSVSELRAGKTIALDRSDTPEFEDMLALEAQGLVISGRRMKGGERIGPTWFCWVGPA